MRKSGYAAGTVSSVDDALGRATTPFLTPKERLNFLVLTEMSKRRRLFLKNNHLI